MKLQHYHSDCNGLKLDSPNFETPTESEVVKARVNGGMLEKDNCKIYVSERIVEVRALIGDSLARNLYRDMYRIL